MECKRIQGFWDFKGWTIFIWHVILKGSSEKQWKKGQEFHVDVYIDPILTHVLKI